MAAHTISIASIRALYSEILSCYYTWMSCHLQGLFFVLVFQCDTIVPYHSVNWKQSSLAKWPYYSRVLFRSLCGFHNKAVYALCLGCIDSLSIDVRSILWNTTNNFDSTIQLVLSAGSKLQQVTLLLMLMSCYRILLIKHQHIHI